MATRTKTPSPKIRNGRSQSSAVESTDKPRLRESVYEQLLQMIFQGDLLPGYPVSELELARKLNVSRTPVHEAISQLTQDGLVIQVRNRRPEIAEFSGEDVFDIFEMRRILEGEAAFKAATRLDRLTLESLRAEADRFATMGDEKEAIEAWVKLDDHFHATIASAAGSPRLEEDILRYRRLHRAFNRTHTDPSILRHALQEHLVILDTLEQRSASAARDAMQRHVSEWQRFFVRHLT